MFPVNAHHSHKQYILISNVQDIGRILIDKRWCIPQGKVPARWSISSKKMDTPTPKMTSDLCKPLSAILMDSSSVSMLDYFIQFMDSESALHIVQFWLTVEAFKSAPSSSSSVRLPPSSGHSSQSCELQSQVKGQRIDKNMVQDCPTTLSSRDEVMCVRPTFCDESSQVSHDISCDPRHPSVPSSTDVAHDPRHPSSNHNSSLRSEDGASSVSASQEISLSYCSRLVTDTGSKCNNYLYSDNRSGCSSKENTLMIGCESESHDQRQNVPSSIVLSKQNSLSVGIDAMEIYTTYVALNATSPVGTPAEIRQRIEVNICPEDGQINRLCFEEAQAHVYSTLETRYYTKFVRSSYLCKYQLEYISSGSLTLLDFLLADNALFYFMEYMEQEDAPYLINFWLMAENFHNHLSSSSHVHDIDVDTTDAIAIYDRFFSLQASTPLGLGDSVRMDIENKICDQHGPRANSFSTAQEIVYRSMCEVHYPTFLKSSIYLRFLNELVHMLNSDSPAVSAPASIGNQANGIDTHNEYKEDLDDPDALWKQTPALMRLGYVDEFGQYISEVNCEPQKDNSKGRFAWMIRKREQEEELTMRIAKNIVTEVLESCKTAAVGTSFGR